MLKLNLAIVVFCSLLTAVDVPAKEWRGLVPLTFESSGRSAPDGETTLQ
jgi:hypothetical protein